jgi:hypothetical protein
MSAFRPTAFYNDTETNKLRGLLSPQYQIIQHYILSDFVILYYVGK